MLPIRQLTIKDIFYSKFEQTLTGSLSTGEKNSVSFVKLSRFISNMGDLRKRPTTITSMVRKTNAKNKFICIKFLGHLSFLKKSRKKYSF
jgi:hypothetical protein